LLKRLFNNFRWGVLPVPGRLIAVIFFVSVFVLPLISGPSSYALFILMFTNIYVIYAVSWDLLSGYTGQVNFGHALFFGVGAYGSALLYKYLGWPPGVTIPLGALIATLIGVATCFPALRLRGPYLSLLTMSFPLILVGIIMSFQRFSGGSYGIWGLPPIADSRVVGYYVVLIVMTASVLIMWKLTDAGSKYVRTGLIFHAIREDEITARATGINTINYKILAFAIGGFFGGIAGAMYAHVLSLASPPLLSLTMSFQVIIWTIFGGMVSIYGPVVGVYSLFLLMDALRGVPVIAQHRFLILSVIVIVMLLFMPEGVAVWIRDKIERECPRCKLTNGAWRRECRACSAPLR
jgi:branched-chain amino acid transport system permease protein